MKTAIAALLALGVLATGASARTVFDQINDTAPRSIFDQIADTTPRSPFDRIAETTPKSIWEQIQETSPRSADVFGDLQRTSP